MWVSALGWTLLACLGFLPGCRPGPRAGQQQAGADAADASRGGAGAMEEMRGKVAVTGSEPGVSISLIPLEGPSVRLIGSLRGELGRLSGATIRVRGVPGGGPPSGTFDVRSYELLEIDGEVPRVGIILAGKDGGLRLAGRDTVELGDPPEDLTRRVGAKVWVVGRPAGTKFGVQSFGIIREAGRPSPYLE